MIAAAFRAITNRVWRRTRCHMPLCGRAARYSLYCYRHFVDIHAPRHTRAVRR